MDNKKLTFLLLCMVHHSYSLICPAISSNLVSYKVQPKEGDKLAGSCLPHSVVAPYESTTPYIICRENGNYTLIGECVCEKGYFKNATRCQGCSEGTTKPEVGNSKCIRHGRNTIGCDRLTHVCPCEEKYFRLVEELNMIGSHCYEPGKVRRIIYSNKTDGSVIIKWRSPFQKSGYQTVYNVAMNNGKYKRTTKRILRIPSSNSTKHFAINIITEVKVGETIYRGDEFSDTFTVHRYIDSSANQISRPLSVILSVVLFTAFFLMLNS